jgi:hypothetical protein
VSEECSILRPPQLKGTAISVEQDEATNPGDVGPPPVRML